MNKKHSFLILLTAILFPGCASKVNEDVPWAKPWIGREGYFQKNPNITSSNDKAKYLPCEKSKILGFQSIGGGWIYVNIQQAESKYSFSTALNEQKSAVPILDETFVSDLKLSQKKQKFSTGTSSRAEIICKNNVFIGMSSEEFRVIYPSPEKINRTTTSHGTSEQWVYGEIPNSQYFYFLNGVLTSWQN